MREYRILADQRSAEEISDLLLDAGALSAALEDADADSTDEQPLYGEPGLEPQTQAWPRSIISVLTADGFDFKGALDAAVAQAGCEAPKLLETSDVENQDWVRITQAQFQPSHVSPRLWIVPSWSEPPATDAVIIRLDPGVAFGTGSHPTTRVVVANILANPLKLLAPALLGRVAPGGSLVLSGILARQADEVIAAYRAADPGLPLKLWREENGWVCLAGTRSAQAEA